MTVDSADTNFLKHNVKKCTISKFVECLTLYNQFVSRRMLLEAVKYSEQLSISRKFRHIRNGIQFAHGKQHMQLKCQ